MTNSNQVCFAKIIGRRVQEGKVGKDGCEKTYYFKKKVAHHC